MKSERTFMQAACWVGRAGDVSLMHWVWSDLGNRRAFYLAFSAVLLGDRPCSPCCAYIVTVFLSEGRIVASHYSLPNKPVIICLVSLHLSPLQSQSHLRIY